MIREPEKLEPYPVPDYPHPGQNPFPDDDPAIVFPAGPGYADWEQAVYRVAPEGDQEAGIGEYEQHQLDNLDDADFEIVQ